MKKLPLLAIMLLLLGGCDDAATFSSPQPFGTNAAATFAPEILGSYTDSSHSFQLALSANMLLLHYHYTAAIDPDNMPAHQVLRGGMLTDTLSGVQYAIMRREDSLLVSMTTTDTLFATAGPNVLTYHRGAYYLNTHRSDSSYAVAQLNVNGRDLELRTIEEDDDVMNLQKITKIQSHKFGPTPQQFDHYLSQGGFASILHFTRE